MPATDVEQCRPARISVKATMVLTQSFPEAVSIDPDDEVVSSFMSHHPEIGEPAAVWRKNVLATSPRSFFLTKNQDALQGALMI